MNETKNSQEIKVVQPGRMTMISNASATLLHSHSMYLKVDFSQQFLFSTYRVI